jgi:tetratricopeptide (TPR) repeat protein
MKALEHQHMGEYDQAIETYNTLYEKSSKTNYLIEAAKISFLTNNNAKTSLLIQKALEVEPTNSDLLRIKIALLMKENKVIEASKDIEKLLQIEKNSRNLTIAGAIFFQLKSYELSLKYFQSAYKESLDENVLLNMVDVLYSYLDRKDEAVAYLETHTRMQTCSRKACLKLVEIYGREQNIDGIISVYKRMYARFNEDEFAKKVVELLLYKKDKQGAIDFLSSTSYDQRMLLDIYVSSSDFDNAYKIASQLYEDGQDINDLGRLAIYEYEKNKNKLNKKILNSVAKKFEKVVQVLEEPLYLNYYGYLLIDHDINIQKGIDLVQRALKKEPNSIFYLDSLAWGLYKQRKCLEAKEILDRFIDTTQEEEVLMHYKKIKECLQQ